MSDLKIGLGDLAQLFLIGLKAFGYVNWSWFAVLLPLWITFGYVLGKNENSL